MLSKKRKYEEENRVFNTDWEEEFVFVERNCKPMCLLCQTTLSQFKASNLKRHHDTNHGGFCKDFPIGSQLRKTKLKSLKEKLDCQSRVMSMFTKEADLTTEAGLVLAFNIAKAKKPYTEGEFIKKNMSQRISVISGDIVGNLQQNLSECSAISLALDESTDVKDKPQLAIFVRYVTKDLEVEEELLDLVTLNVTTRGCDIKEALDGVLLKNSVPKGSIVSIATDGAPAMAGKKQGLIGLLNEDTSYPDFLPVHCIIHREHLAAKYFQYPQIMQVVLKIVNYIRSSAKTHRQFKSFLEGLDNDELPDDVSWYCLVRWLSVSNVLDRFFQLLDPIKQFMREKEKSFPELDDPQWLLDLAFFTDVVQHLQTLNISLQGREKLISDLAQSVFGFHSKLRLFRKDLETKTFAHFKCLKKIIESNPDVQKSMADLMI
ncbi:general transcription factor II-I repeat domain-containing protein 2-like [Daktulosphaira vitifoliae]|uniref:general transcription factor II-I repeat domain-containing protein 2-like n=1 Tax=Daktulosphaira vitifoliae TaxID=58002 RepID=UPI0021AA65C6|nr:general transcription factor II-I repeat domain-containing protein 2-like [Daktulosphaira vitifoliae]